MLRWLERLLLTIGILSLAYVVYVSSEATLYQAFENRELDAILKSRPQTVETSLSSSESPPSNIAPQLIRPTSSDVIGRVDIPRLGVSAIVRTGIDARTLRLAVGHIPGTALPGQPGNVGLAGHRDTFFRRLRHIRADDEIRFTGPDGVLTYRVERTLVVRPEDVWVLDPTARPSLTLVTCYPFTYVGSAPQRFAVRAELVITSSLNADTN
jgi:sortase A